MNTDLPKKIYFLWLQGMDNAPLVVKKCYESWIKHNPGWEMVFFDEHNIAEHIDLPEWDIPKYVVSELLRINLLAKYGGVWVDATCFCVRPLDEWLYDYMDAGFFAFDRPGHDRMISSWFLASNKYNYITLAYQKAMTKFWAENTGIRLIEQTKWKFIYKHLEKRNPQIWFSTLFTKILKIHPYFWFHYLFQHVYLKDAGYRELWDSVPKFSADIPHRVLFAGLSNPLTEQLKSEIDQKSTPIYKLTWKYDFEAGNQPGTVLDYLLNK